MPPLTADSYAGILQLKELELKALLEITQAVTGDHGEAALYSASRCKPKYPCSVNW